MHTGIGVSEARHWNVKCNHNPASGTPIMDPSVIGTSLLVIAMSNNKTVILLIRLCLILMFVLCQLVQEKIVDSRFMIDTNWCV